MGFDYKQMEYCLGYGLELFSASTVFAVCQHNYGAKVLMFFGRGNCLCQ